MIAESPNLVLRVCGWRFWEDTSRSSGLLGFLRVTTLLLSLGICDLGELLGTVEARNNAHTPILMGGYLRAHVFYFTV